MKRRWLKIRAGVAAAVTTIVGFFVLLSSLYGFTIIDLTGDIVCAGTYENPCISEFEVRNPNAYVVDVYSKDQVKLDFSPDVKDWALFVPDGRCSATGKCACDMQDGSRLGFEDWRCVDFTNKTKPRKDKVYNFRFPAYSRTHFLLAGIKNDPSDEIKWTFGTNEEELDPIWNGVSSSIFIAESGIGWNFDIIEDPKQEVDILVEGINESTIELTLFEHINSANPQNYRWNMALCSNVTSLKYQNEDTQGGFDNAVSLDVNYGKLTDFGLNETWCDGGDGYILFSSGSKNQLPKKIRLLTGNMTEFKLFAGTGSAVLVATSGGTSLDASGKNICRDSSGTLHVTYEETASNGLWYANSSDNGLTWSSKEVRSFTNDNPGIVCGLTNNLTIFFTNSNDIDIFESSDSGASWGGLTTGFDLAGTMDKASCALDSNDVVHCVASDVTNSDLYYANSTFWNTEILLGEQVDGDTGNIRVDINNNVYIIGTGLTDDDVDIWSSIDSYATKNLIDANLGTVGLSDLWTIGMEIDVDGNIYYAGIHSSQLQFCNGTTTDWDGGSGSWTCQELSASNAWAPDLAVSQAGEIYILQDNSSTDSTTAILRSNSSDGGLTFESRTIMNIQPATKSSIAGSLFPTSNRPNNVLRYVFANDTGVYYDSFSITPSDSVSPKWFDNSTNNTEVSLPNLFSVNWTDDVNLSSYIFGWFNGVNWSQTNNSGDKEAGTQTFSGAVGGTGLNIFDDFEAGFSGNWTDDGIVEAWTRDSLGTPSSSTGPQPQGSAEGADGSVWYIYVETSSAECNTVGETAIVYSPSIDFDSGENDKINWSNSMFGADIGTLLLQENTTGSWVTKWTMTGNKGSSPVWFQNETDLSSLTGTGNLRFHYTCAGGFTGDIAIDQINFTSTGGSSDVDANKTATEYTDVVSNIYTQIDNITITVNVSYYNNSGSVNNANLNNTLWLEVYNGTDWIDEGNFSIGEDQTIGNYSLTVTTTATLIGWQTDANRDVRISARLMDYNATGLFDTLNWTDVWIEVFNQQTFLNDSNVLFTGTANWSNVTKTLTSTESVTIKWYVWANDTSNNANQTDTFEFTTTGGAADSCTYTSGNWNVVCSDNCTITSNIDLNGNNLTLDKTGGNFTLLGANITDFDNIIINDPGICRIRIFGSDSGFVTF